MRGFEGEFEPKKRGRKGKKGRVGDEDGEGGEGVTGSEEGLTTTTEETQSEEEVLRADKGKGKVSSFLLWPLSGFLWVYLDFSLIMRLPSVFFL